MLVLLLLPPLLATDAVASVAAVCYACETESCKRVYSSHRCRLCNDDSAVSLLQLMQFHQARAVLNIVVVVVA